MHLSINNGNTLKDIPTDVDVAVMGINPSKCHLHQGHYLTLYQLLKLLDSRKALSSIIFIDDREFDNRKHEDDSSHLPLIVPPSNVVENINHLISTFVINIANQMPNSTIPNRVEILRMSKYMASHDKNNSTRGHELFNLIWENRQTIKAHFNFSSSPKKQIAFRPFCNTCAHATMREVNLLGNSVLSATCGNHNCEVDQYSVNIPDGSTDFFINYLLDPLRDVQIAQDHGGVIHIFGGDYATPWGMGGTSKADRLAATVDSLIQSQPSSSVVHQYTGPVLMKNGEKIAKSNGDKSAPLTVEELERILKDRSSRVELSYY